VTALKRICNRVFRSSEKKPHWLNGPIGRRCDGVVKALQEDSHMLDVLIWSSSQRRAKQLILVDAGAGICGWGTSGVCGQPPQRQWLHAGRVSPRFGYAPPSDHVGGLTTQTESGFFPSRCLRRQAESDFCYRRKSLLSPKGGMRSRSSRSAQP